MLGSRLTSTGTYQVPYGYGVRCRCVLETENAQTKTAWCHNRHVICHGRKEGIEPTTFRNLPLEDSVRFPLRMLRLEFSPPLHLLQLLPPPAEKDIPQLEPCCTVWSPYDVCMRIKREDTGGHTVAYHHNTTPIATTCIFGNWLYPFHWSCYSFRNILVHSSRTIDTYIHTRTYQEKEGCNKSSIGNPLFVCRKKSKHPSGLSRAPPLNNP
jgi:hypothetical protein